MVHSPGLSYYNLTTHIEREHPLSTIWGTLWEALGTIANFQPIRTKNNTHKKKNEKEKYVFISLSIYMYSFIVLLILMILHYYNFLRFVLIIYMV